MFGFDPAAWPRWVAFLAQAGDEAGGVMQAEPVGAGAQTDFQAYIFWAYGFVCLLLFAFSVWSVRQMASLDRRIDEMQSRVDDAAAKRGA